ncbi:MAG: SUMF1/EgtB/PvdO family nonheme iron enzyme [Planctomycetota bacterium]
MTSDSTTPGPPADPESANSPSGTSSDSGPVGPQLHQALGLAPNPDSIDELDEILPATRAALHAAGLRQIIRIAAGAFGVVCRATDQVTSNLRAVKILLEPQNTDAQRMFQRECRILDAPELPPGLVPRFYRAVEPPDGQPFMILEWIEGETLGDYLAAHPALPVADREQLCLNVCHAYAQLHAAHLLQRDPSLNNILVSPGGRIRLIDFGGGGRPNPGYRSLQTLPAVPVTHAFASDAVRSRERRPTAADEVHAIARICFTILCGKIAAQHPLEELPQQLADARIPADFHSVILHYLRQPPPDSVSPPGNSSPSLDSWHAATLAGRLDATLQQRATQHQLLLRRRSQRTVRAAQLCLGIALALLLASHLVLNRSLTQGRRQVQQQEEQLRRHRALLKEQLEAVGAQIDDFRQRLSPPLPLLSQRLELLRQRRTRLREELDTLPASQLQQLCDALLLELLELHQDHTAALSCEQQFGRWKRLAAATPQHIQQTPEFTAIRTLADTAATADNAARWDTASRRLAEASSQLEDLLRTSGEHQLVTPLSPQPQFRLVFTETSLDPRDVAQIQQQLAESLRIPITLQNSIGMSLPLIPAGEFLQGSPATEPGRKATFAGIDPERQRRVRISRPFRLAATEVTQAQWQTVMHDQPWHGQLNVETGPDYPAAWATWAMQVEFTQKLSALEKQIYRLPTEAEWEYACRAGTLSAWSFGDQPALLNDFAWTRFNSSGRAHPVRQKLPNPLGLFDMHGNLLEYCLDQFAEYAAGPVSDPRCETGEGRINRGGSFRNDPLNNTFRSAYRTYDPDQTRNESLGFRVLLELPFPSDINSP